MKKYKVIVTPDAEGDLKTYLDYLQNVKKNPQAVQNVIEDFKETKQMLSTVAGSLAEPDSRELRERSLKRINFRKHNYFITPTRENPIRP